MTRRPVLRGYTQYAFRMSCRPSVLKLKCLAIRDHYYYCCCCYSLSPTESSRSLLSFFFFCSLPTSSLHIFFLFQPVLIVFAPTQTILFKYKTGCGQTATMTEVIRSLITTIGSALFRQLRGTESPPPTEEYPTAEDSSSLWNRCQDSAMKT